jgi:hypothetical protein
MFMTFGLIVADEKAKCGFPSSRSMQRAGEKCNPIE